MQLIYHFIGLVTAIVILHFIFIEIQYLVHLKNGNSLQGAPSRISLPSIDRGKLITQINTTLIGLQEELRRHKQSNTRQHNIQTEKDRPTSSPDGKVVEVSKRKKLKAVIFTMDCITSYEQNSKNGGAAGELIVRRSLEDAFRHHHISLKIIRSDAEFALCNMNEYDIILLDSWTWAAKGSFFAHLLNICFIYMPVVGWVPKRNIINQESKIYVLDFFGSSKLRSSTLHISMKNQVLTAFKSPWNTFLGYYIPNDRLNLASRNKLDQGVIWGKDPKYFTGRELMLSHLANKVRLVSTATETIFHHRNVEWRGHQTGHEWLSLLASSKFLLGLGHPLLGPSAIDAVSLGCIFINPIYRQPQLEAKYPSQHPYIEEVAPEYVCSYEEENIQQLLACVDKALRSNLKPFIPNDFKKEEYFRRINNIFKL